MCKYKDNKGNLQTFFIVFFSYTIRYFLAASEKMATFVRNKNRATIHTDNFKARTNRLSDRREKDETSPYEMSDPTSGSETDNCKEP